MDKLKMKTSVCLDSPFPTFPTFPTFPPFLLFSVISLFCLISLFSLSLWPSTLLADEVDMAFPEVAAPWVIKEKKKGIIVEVVEKALQVSGHHLKFHFIPWSQLDKILQERPELDGVSLVEKGKVSDPRFFSSEITSFFNTSFVSLKENKNNTQTMEGFKGKKVVAFRGAKALGPLVEKLKKTALSYVEVDDQKNQVEMLYQKKADILLMDKLIFLYWRKNLDSATTAPEVEIESASNAIKIVAESPARVIFRDKRLRDQFNEGLASIKGNGEYKKIIDFYINPFSYIK